MAALELLAVAVFVILVAALAWRRTSARRHARLNSAVTEQQARENAAPLSTAILSPSRTHQRDQP